MKWKWEVFAFENIWTQDPFPASQNDRGSCVPAQGDALSFLQEQKYYLRCLC